jgi:hypothetical protein
MVGRAGRSGRPPGKNMSGTNLAAYALGTLVEQWLAGAPILIGGKLIAPPDDWRQTVPPKTMKLFLEFAIRQTMHTAAWHHQQYGKSLAPLRRDAYDDKRILAEFRRRAPPGSLRRRRRQT